MKRRVQYRAMAKARSAANRKAKGENRKGQKPWRELSPDELRARIHSFRGIFKRKPGEKSILQDLMEERGRDREREDR